MAGSVPTLAEVLNNVGTATISARLPGLQDNFYGSNPLTKRLLDRDKIIEDGGKDVRQRIIYEKKPGGSYAAGDTFTNERRETKTEMVFDWKLYHVDIVLYGLDLLKNAGGKMIHDLVSDEMDEAELSAAEYLGVDVFTGTGSNKLTGLRVAFDDGTTYTTYGQIPRSTTAATAGLAVSGTTTTTAATTFSLPQMNTFMQRAAIGNRSCDMIVTTQTLWNKWWERAQPSQRIEQGGRKDTPVANLGFKTIYQNGAEVVVDSHCQASHVYFINTDFLKLVVHKSRTWTPSGWLYPTNQDSVINHLYFAGELVCKSPRMHNVATNVS